MAERDLEHPVWDADDRRPTVRLRDKYFSARLRMAEQHNFAMDAMVAVAEPASECRALTASGCQKHWGARGFRIFNPPRG